MAPVPLLVVERLLCLHQSTRRSNLINSLPILTLLLHVFICTHCFAQHTQMNMLLFKDDALPKGENGGGIKKICLIDTKLEDNRSQFIQKPMIEKPMFEKANRITAPTYSLQPHQRRRDDANIDCGDILSGSPLRFWLRNNHMTPFLLSVAPNITKK